MADLPRTDNVRINWERELDAPAQLHAEFPMTPTAAHTVTGSRAAIHAILNEEDPRLLVIVGPCSIHDVVAAREYGARLKAISAELHDALLVVMRVYFEKPRTTIGWKGLINDPHLDGSYDINAGLRLARALLRDLNDSGLPTATEFLDLVTGQYYADLVSWGAIGARTTESQVHRELASGLSCPVGFKNGTDGNVRIAIDAVRAAREPHIFLSPTKQGRTAIFSSRGNADAHIILRGGRTPNYAAASIDCVANEMRAAGLAAQLVIDCSHANSGKDYQRQIAVCTDVAGQLRGGETRIAGVMIESHLTEGRQDVVPGRALNYGQSITDACLGWQDSATLLHELANAVRASGAYRSRLNEAQRSP